MKKKKSFIIINDNSEYKTFEFLKNFNKNLLKSNLTIIDRRSKEDYLNSIEKSDYNEYQIIYFHTSQKWFEFLFSAIKASKQILNLFEIDELFVFCQYDPLAAILINSSPNLKLNLISHQQPYLYS